MDEAANPGAKAGRRSRWSIAVVIFVLTWSIAAALTVAVAASNFVNGRARALDAAAAMMDRSVESVGLRLERQFAPVERAVRLSDEWEALATLPGEQGHPLRPRFMRMLADLEQLSSVYAGWDNGDYYLLGAARHRPAKRLEEMGAPAGTVFIEEIILRSGRSASLLVDRLLDAQGNVLKTTTAQGDEFDPRARPWFVNASAAPGVALTDVYRFVGSGNPGVSLSQRTGAAVAGVDITLGALDALLDEMPEAQSGLVAIASAGGDVLARSGTAARTRSGTALSGAPERDAAIAGLLELDPVTFAGAAPFELGERPWIGRIAEVRLGAGEPERLFVAMPVGVVVAPLIEGLRVSALVAFGLLLASGPLVWLIARRLSVPLTRLVLEAEDIRRFHLAHTAHPGSPVAEILDLEQAMASMRANMRTFAMYVPKALVKRLVRRGEIPQIGGERRDITVLFLDMENFTAMSERLEPEAVMERMSEFFEAVTRVLLAHDATIDKFIGDAVMAFWNAPGDSADHVAAACAAALQIQQQVKPLTDSWSAEGGKPLRTRIGLHTGPAIVGNVGSSDRMNYTALGATVNLAARLESRNRDLGTAILVSGAVANAVETRFALRPAGETELKGFSVPVQCFELLGRVEAESEHEEAKAESEPALSVASG